MSRTKKLFLGCGGLGLLTLGYTLFNAVEAARNAARSSQTF